MTAFSRAAFLASAGRPSQFLPEGPPEIAFLGRSNVGKSSAINALAGRRRLAYASKAPGCTQTVNFYELGVAGRLVDLPGYGFARAPRSERAGWGRLVGDYLFGRHTLAGVVVLMDVRHPLTPQDAKLVQWMRPLRVGRLFLLAKSDKLSRAERRTVLENTRRLLGSDAGEVLLFSSASGEGVAEARLRLEQWLRKAGSAAGNKRPPAKGKTTGGETP